MDQTKQSGAVKPKHTGTLVNNSAEENPDSPRRVPRKTAHFPNQGESARRTPKRYGRLRSVGNRGGSGGRELTGTGRSGRVQSRAVAQKGKPKVTPMSGPDQGVGVTESKTTEPRRKPNSGSPNATDKSSPRPDGGRRRGKGGRSSSFNTGPPGRRSKPRNRSREDSSSDPDSSSPTPGASLVVKRTRRRRSRKNKPEEIGRAHV